MSTEADLDTLIRNIQSTAIGMDMESESDQERLKILAAEAKQAVNAYITATCSQVISDDEQYQEIAYPKTDNEGEVLWSKNAIRESRKQRMQRVVDRNDLRAEQRRTLARLRGGTEICTCDCHTRQGAEQDNHCSLC